MHRTYAENVGRVHFPAQKQQQHITENKANVAALSETRSHSSLLVAMAWLQIPVPFCGVSSLYSVAFGLESGYFLPLFNRVIQACALCLQSQKLASKMRRADYCRRGAVPCIASTSERRCSTDDSSSAKRICGRLTCNLQ